MNGAKSLIRTLAAGGVDTCFTNPGTSEMHLVAALDHETRIRCVLGLFEGVVTGAADGYARLAEKPACTLLHLGPGFANGLANMHNASRAQVPMVNLIGQHPEFHLKYDTPLASDIEGFARPYSKWLRTSRSPQTVSRDAAEAVLAARTAPGRIATLIVPTDVAWSEGAEECAVPSPPAPTQPSPEAIARAVNMLRSGARTALVLAGSALYGKGLATAGRIAASANAKLLAPYPFARLERGAGLPPVDRTHYVLEQAIDQLKEFRQFILVGASQPVAYFAYPDKSSVLTQPGAELLTLAKPGEDYVGALESVAAELPSGERHDVAAKAERPPVPTGEITLQGIAFALGAFLPENAIVSDESMTSGRGLMAATRGAPRHDWLACTGGSIGIAMPLAVGAAVACPDRRVLCLTADGSSMYTLQALWTMARESLNVTTVVFANRVYGVLKREYAGLGIGEPGPRASNLFEIGRPDLDWVMLARGMGVPAVRASSMEEFAKALGNGLEAAGPSLIEVRV
jgi:acetolactate synthase I/II/III large subunit